MCITDRRFTRTARVLVCSLAACAIATPSAVARAAIADGGASSASAPRTDFRSPDTRDAAEGYAPKPAEPAPRTDFRSPDTRDAAEGYAPKYIVATDGAVEASRGGGFDWGSAGIGIAGAAGLLIIALAMFGSVRYGRGRVARP